MEHKTYGYDGDGRVVECDCIDCMKIVYHP